MRDSLAPAAVAPRLRGRFGRDYRYAARCTSTQRLLDRGAPEGAVAVADEQTEGRGRLDRRWHAPAGTSLLCSLLLRPEVDAERLPELSVVAAEACVEAIAAVAGVHAVVKFPNDVLVAGRKVAGILGEASAGSVVLGIGVNVNQTARQLPRRVRLPATSLLIESGSRVDRAELLAVLLERLEHRYDAWLAARR